jgi:zinc protease
LNRRHRDRNGGGKGKFLALWLRPLAIVLTCLVACSHAPRTPVARIQFRMRDFHYRSGLRVVVEEDHSAPVVGVIAIVGAGSTSDPPGQEGLAHLVEHLTFRAKHAEGRSLWSLLDQAGGARKNGYTSFDATAYYEFGPRDALLDLLLLEGLRLTDPLANVDDQTFAVEREVVRNELRERNETDVSGAVWAKMLAVTYPPGHPYARPAIGSHESLSSITLEDARLFAKRHYRPANMTLLVIGDVNLESVDKALTETLSPALNQPTNDRVVSGSRLAPGRSEPPSPPPLTGMATVAGPVTTPELYITWSLPRSYDEAAYVADFAAGGAELAATRADDPDIVSASATIAHGSVASTLLLHVLLREGKEPKRSVQRILDRLHWEADRPETDFQLFRRRAQTTTAMLAIGEDVVRRGRERAEFIHFSGNAALYTRKFQALSTMDAGTLSDVYSRYINRDRARVVLIEPAAREGGTAPMRTGVAEPLETSLTDAAYDIATIEKAAIPAGLSTTFHRTRLANGLTVETARHGTQPIVVIGLGFRGGTANEPSQGSSLLAANSPGEYARSLGNFSDYGALVDERNARDRVQVTVWAPSFLLPRVLAILAYGATHTRVKESSLQSFEKNLLPYFRRIQKDPEEVDGRAFRRALFGTHLYSHSTTVSEDRAPDRVAANRWLDSIITPEHATLAIAGDIDPDEAQRLARDAFAGWKGPPAPEDPPPLPASGTGAVIVTHRAGATQAQLTLGCRLPPSDAAGRLRIAVLAQALDWRVARIRNETGTSYGLRASIATFGGGTSVLYVQGAVENAGLASALKAIRRGLSGPDGLTAAEVDRGRWAVARAYNLELATASDWVQRALTLGRMGWSLESEDDLPRALGSVDREQLRASLRPCATEGVLWIIGDEPTIRRSVADAWK